MARLQQEIQSEPAENSLAFLPAFLSGCVARLTIAESNHNKIIMCFLFAPAFVVFVTLSFPKLDP